MRSTGPTRMPSPLIWWGVCLCATVVLFFAGDLLGGCNEHETASTVWAVLMLILMAATLALAVWAMAHHSSYWFLVLLLVLATGALFVIPLWLTMIVLSGCDLGYEF